MQATLGQVRIALVGGLFVATLAWMLPPLGARSAPRAVGMKPALRGAMAGGGLEPPTPRIYFKAPVTAEAAAVWIKLQQKMAARFAGGISLGKFVEAIQEATKDKDNPDGLTFYIDPVGLMECEKTLDSDIALNLGNVRIATALKLALDQLDLTFVVDPEGIVRVTAQTSNGGGDNDPDELVLDRLEALQKQVKELHDLVAPREAPPSAAKK